MSNEKEFPTVPIWIQNPVGYLAMRAILIQCQKHAMPKSYMIDLASDFSLITEHRIEKFVFVLRPYGSQMFAPLALDGVEQVDGFGQWVKHLDSGAIFFTFDVREVRNGQVNPSTGKSEWDDYNEPQLRECTVEEARQYLDDLYQEDRKRKRILLQKEEKSILPNKLNTFRYSFGTKGSIRSMAEEKHFRYFEFQGTVYGTASNEPYGKVSDLE